MDDLDNLDALIRETRHRTLLALEALSKGVSPDDAVLNSGLLLLFDDGESDPTLGDGLNCQSAILNQNFSLDDLDSEQEPDNSLDWIGPTHKVEPASENWLDSDPLELESLADWSKVLPEAISGRLEAALFNTASESDGGLDPLWGAYHALAEMLRSCDSDVAHGSGVQITFALVSWYHELLRHAPNALWRHRLRGWMGQLSDRVVASPELAQVRFDAVQRLGSVSRLIAAIEEWSPDLVERQRLQRMLYEGQEVAALSQALEQAVFRAMLDGTYL